MATAEPEVKTDLQSWLKMVERLRHSSDWPPEELPIEMRQTHISVLLLSRNYVVKLKKPVDFGFLDYTTLSKRHKACQDEVRLNRRLCPDTYLRYGSVTDENEEIGFSGQHGKIVDYCVWMKRLPEERMLDQLVATGAVTEGMIDCIAARLCEFHRHALRGPEVARWGSLAEIRHNWEENFAQTTNFIDRTISTSAFESIRTWVNEWLTTKTDLFARRIQEGRIVDGHGDVRCESICVQDDAICIYDCIEFNERFRCDDVASEVAFLAMDLDARGRPDLGYYFAEQYDARVSDPDLFSLLPFYRCYRAYVRGKVLSFELEEIEFSETEKEAAAVRAQHYFDLAERYAKPVTRPMMIAVSGLSGTGKTSVARAIANELGLRVISSDAVRQSLFGADKKPASYGAGAYTADATQRTYQMMIENACDWVNQGQSVILDATFLRAENRAVARAAATQVGAEWRMIECQLEPETVRARLAQRAAKGEGLSDATWEIYLRQREAQQIPENERDAAWFALDTASDLSITGHTAADWLRNQAGARK